MIILPLAILLTAAKPLPQCDVLVPAPFHQTKTVVKVYQTPQQPGSLTVQSAAEDVLSFYLFDLDGNLVYQSRLKQHEQQTIEGLQPGTYTYHAFDADEKLKGGKVDLKN